VGLQDFSNEIEQEDGDDECEQTSNRRRVEAVCSQSQNDESSDEKGQDEHVLVRPPEGGG
jgi:hypothetical protein